MMDVLFSQEMSGFLAGIFAGLAVYHSLKAIQHYRGRGVE